MSFAEEFRQDRKRLEEKFLDSPNILIAQADVLEKIVLKEFSQLRKVATTATHLRVTAHCDVKGIVTYNTRLNGEYNVKDSVADGVTKDILTAAVMLVETCKDDPMESWADGLSAREEYDTDTEMSVYTFEFCG